VKQTTNIGVEIMPSSKSLPNNSDIDKLEKNIANTPVEHPSFADTRCNSINLRNDNLHPITKLQKERRISFID
jgi:hypothetical protein